MVGWQASSAGDSGSVGGGGGGGSGSGTDGHGGMVSERVYIEQTAASVSANTPLRMVLLARVLLSFKTPEYCVWANFSPNVLFCLARCGSSRDFRGGGLL